MEFFFELPIWIWFIIVIAAFFSAVLHGATGMLGGILMTAILSQIIGIKQAVPVMTCALVFSHASRTFLYWKNTDRKIVARILLFGFPTLILGAYIFSYLDPKFIALVFVIFLILSFPVKYWARRNNIKTSIKVLSGASMVWGLLAGNVVGPGFFLAPFLLGTGMSRLTFVGTMATITLLMNIVKLVVFSSTEIMSYPLFTLGIVIGLISIPANWLGKSILNKITDTRHLLVIDIFTVLIIVNFIYLAI